MSLTVVRSVGLVSLQDAGRPGHMHEGLAPGGALVPELLALANRRAGNDDGTAGIEVMGTMTLRADTAITAATDTEPARRLEAGDEFSVTSSRFRAAYVAVAGGLDAPSILGSRSAQLSAGFGRLLRGGDRLAAGEAAVVPRSIVEFDPGDAVDIIPGPDIDAFPPEALRMLLDEAWTISPSSNRVGTRLDGPHLPRLGRPDVTRPMVRGAIEVPPDGQPIVLGPEHPTTGGYPVIAVVAADALGPVFAVPLGGIVRFRVRSAVR